MNNLNIPIATSEINGESIQATNARDLHKVLESKQEFAHWIKNRVKDYLEGIDYIVIDETPEGHLDKFIKGRFGSGFKKEYHISMDMAKELSMLERNHRGREARRYFVDCEKKYRDAQPRIKEKPALRLVTEESYLEIVAQKEELCSKYIALLEENAYQVKKPRRTHRPITPEDTAEIITLFAQGLSQKEIALQVGRSSATVSTTVRNHVAKGGAA